MKGENNDQAEKSADELRQQIAERLQNLTPEQLRMFIDEVEALLSQE